ncbi:NUDIX hydrolase [Gryllotalpicola sp.]|uniref:NUDIX hydrolase n=1 Tax=Gryllotalpicola sp. TaxID=1932787 RepID=UPI0026038A9F|nr:NUDIX hydrolase [Gryllotalpicola sp.]
MVAPNATLAVSTVIFALRPTDDPGAESRARSLWIPLVRRLRNPFDNFWALPGGPLPAELDLRDAAAKTVEAVLGFAPRYLEQLYAFGDVDRSGTSGERVVSIVYWALVGDAEARRARLGQNVRWLRADRLPTLAFDHNAIVDYALWRLRNKVEYAPLAQAFIDEPFTITQLREVHEAVLGRRLDPANFRRQLAAAGGLVDTGEHLAGTPHRPPRLYRFDPAAHRIDQGPLAGPGRSPS